MSVTTIIGRAWREWRTERAKKSQQSISTDEFFRLVGQTGGLTGIQGEALPRTSPALDALAERRNTSVSTAVGRGSDAIASLPLQVVTDFTSDRTTITEIVDDHPIAILLRYPNSQNPLFTESEMKQHIFQGLRLQGNAYLRIEKNAKSESGYDLWPILTNDMRAFFSPLGVAEKYVEKRIKQTTNITEEHTWKPEEIIHFRQYNINSRNLGAGSFEAANPNIAFDHYAMRVLNNFWVNDGTPGAIMSPKSERSISPADLETLEKQIKQNHTGVDKKWKWMLLNVAMELQQMQIPIQDVNWKEFFDHNQETILSQGALPPAIAGFLKDASYANAQIQERLFWQLGLIPPCFTIHQVFSNQLLWRLYPEDSDYRVDFDYTKVKALQDDKLIKSQIDMNYVNSDILTVNEIREQMNLPPVAWGDKPRFGFDENALGTDDEDEGDDIGKKSFYIRSKIGSPRWKEWKTFDQFTKQREIKFAVAMRKYFSEQQRRVLDKVNELTSEGRAMAALATIKYLAKDDDNNSFIFNGNKEDAELIKRATPLFTATIIGSADREIARYGLDFAFDLDNPNVLIAMNSFTNRITNVNDTTYKKIIQVLAQSYEQGTGIQAAAKGINEVYKQAKFSRSLLIARTEMVGAVNNGRIEAYRQGDIKRVEWVATQDDVTRDSHRALDGVEQILGARFNNGCLYPGDPNAPIGETANCRCTIVGVV